MTTQYTNEDYINGVVDHETYHSQFVTAHLIEYVGKRFGTRLLKSTNKYFNDTVPLKEWDMMSPMVKIPGRSLAECVCILKTAARKWVEAQSATLGE